jgi:hypothetical protein
MSDVFIVGPARAGTSWLHTTLAEHPDIASPPETELFSSLLDPMQRSWERHRELVEKARDDSDRQLAYGLATVLDDDEFLTMMRSIYATVRNLVLAEKPGATRFLEKTPDHALFIATITRVVPDVQLLFLVRDPRDTVRSLLEARRAEWGHWAPTSVEEATTLWVRNVQAALCHKGDARMMIVRYEDLRDGPAELERVAEFLGLGDPSSWLRTSADVAPGERQSMIVRGEAATGAVRPYDASEFSFHDRKQQRPLTDYEQAYIVSRCRPQMEALGYSANGVHQSLRVRAEFAARSFGRRGRAVVRKVTPHV